jgi:hypothetical protein
VIKAGLSVLAVVASSVGALAASSVPSEVDCAAYYYFSQTPFMLAPSSVEDLFGPQFSWSIKILETAPSNESQQALDAVQDKARELLPVPPEDDFAVTVFTRLVEHYDRPCHEVAGFPAIDVSAGLAKAREIDRGSGSAR